MSMSISRGGRGEGGEIGFLGRRVAPPHLHLYMVLVEGDGGGLWPQWYSYALCH